MKLTFISILACIIMYVAYIIMYSNPHYDIKNNDNDTNKKYVTESNNKLNNKSKESIVLNDIKPKKTIDVNHEKNTILSSQEELNNKTTNVSEKNLPKSIKDVIITPGLEKLLEKRSEKIDYRLKLYNKLSECLGQNAPSSGKITISFLFHMDRKAKIAMGTEGDETNEDHQMAFQITNSELSDEDEQKVILCAKESHLQLYMDIAKKLENDNENNQLDDYFYHQVEIIFPISDNIIYYVLSHDGKNPDDQ